MTDEIREQIKTLRACIGEQCTIRIDYGFEADEISKAIDTMERLLAANEMLNKRVDWTVADNAKKAIQIADMKPVIEAAREYFGCTGMFPVEGKVIDALAALDQTKQD